MPKYNIIIKEGGVIPEDISSFIKKNFSEKDLIKLEKFGGRIQISLTAPFKSDKTKIEISESFVDEIKSNPDTSKDKLKLLTSKQLKQVATQLGLSITSKSNVSQMKNIIVQFLKAPEQWKGIAGK